MLSFMKHTYYYEIFQKLWELKFERKGKYEHANPKKIYFFVPICSDSEALWHDNHSSGKKIFDV